MIELDNFGVRMLVREKGTRERFRQIAASLAMHPCKSTDADDGSGVEVWTTAEQREIASWIEEPRLQGRFVWVRGYRWERIARRFERKLPCMTAVDIAARLITEEWDHDTWVISLYWVGYMARGLPIDVEVFDRAIRDPRPTVRLAAINAWMIQRWDIWRSRVHRAALEDDDARVRAKAQLALTLDAPAT